MGATKEKPAIVPRRSKTDGSISSTTYEFPYMNQPAKKSLRELIYSSKSGKVLGRTPKNWGKVSIALSCLVLSNMFMTDFQNPLTMRRLMISIVWTASQHLSSSKCLNKLILFDLFLRHEAWATNFKDGPYVCSFTYRWSKNPFSPIRLSL